MRDRNYSARRADPDVMREEFMQLPAQLDERSVESHLKAISRTSPEQLPGAVRAIRERWAYKMGGWVERGRLDYLNTVLDQLKVSNAILAQCVEMDDQWTAHQDRKMQRQEDIRQGIPGLKSQATAEELRARIEAARAQQAEHKKKRDDFETPVAIKREPTGEERRRENLRNAEEKIARLQSRMKQHLAEILEGRGFDQLSEEEQEEYRADENMYQDRIRRAKEERLQFE